MSDVPAPVVVAAPRIGNSYIYYIAGFVALSIGLLFSLGGLNMMGIAVSLSIVGTVLLVIGFCFSLFGKIEQRLMDVERAILSFAEPPPPAQPDETPGTEDAAATP